MIYIVAWLKDVYKLKKKHIFENQKKYKILLYIHKLIPIIITAECVPSSHVGGGNDQFPKL